jgi:hypothetical protein
LKYHSPNTDLTALQRELAGKGKSNDEFDEPAGYADADPDDEDEPDEGHWTPRSR